LSVAIGAMIAVHGDIRLKSDRGIFARSSVTRQSVANNETIWYILGQPLANIS